MSEPFPDKVIDSIARDILAGTPTNAIAASYGVNRMTVWRVKTGEHSHLSDLRRQSAGQSPVLLHQLCRAHLRELKKAALTPQVRTAELVKQNRALAGRLAALRVRLDKLSP
jgi:hypothetical protein